MKRARRPSLVLAHTPAGSPPNRGVTDPGSRKPRTAACCLTVVARTAPPVRGWVQPQLEAG